MITTAHAHKSGVIFHFFPRPFKQKKIKALRPKMTKIASRGPALRDFASLFRGAKTYSRYGFIVGEFPSPGLTAGRTDRPLVRPCIVSGPVGEEERLSSGEKTRIKVFLT